MKDVIARLIITAGVILMFFINFSPENLITKNKNNFNQLVKSFNERKNNLSDIENRMDEKEMKRNLFEIRKKISELKRIDIDKLNEDDKIDYKFIESILNGEEIKYQDIRSWKRDPRDYMKFRTISSIINGPNVCEEKIESLKKTLLLINEDLKYGTRQLNEYVPRFQELGLFMAKNSISIFDIEIQEFINSCKSSKKENLISIEKLRINSLKNLKNYITFLETELPKKRKSNFSIGKRTYNKMLKNQFILNYNDETLWEFGWKEFNNTLNKMDLLAKEIDSTKTTQELLISIKNEYPKPYEMIEAHQHWVDTAGIHIRANNLIPIPWKERVNVVPREEFLRKTSYYGNFSRARKKDDEGYFTSEWKINPFEDQWDEKTKNEYLVEHDWGVIIVTAPHETYGGHHIQGLYQMHNPKILRRNNGISLFSEGWGLYNEHLMLETGFYPNKKIQLRQLQLRLWRNARVIYDVGMHTGKLSYEDAIKLMTDKVGFLRWAAQLEIDSSSSRPGYFIGYFIGMTEILKMREEYKKLKGDKFSLSEFHENLLKIGNMPPALMKESLFNKI